MPKKEIKEETTDDFFSDREEDVLLEDGTLKERGFSIRDIGVPNTFFGVEAGMKRGFYGKNGKLEEIAKLFLSGYSYRAISRELGAGRNTVMKFCAFIKKLRSITPKCHCGLASIHKGWCDYRRELYPRISKAKNQYVLSNGKITHLKYHKKGSAYIYLGYRNGKPYYQSLNAFKNRVGTI